MTDARTSDTAAALPGQDVPQPHHAGNDYPMLDLPFSALIDGRRYSGAGLSLIEARVAGLVDPDLEGREKVVRLTFDFPGFQMVLTPSARLHISGESELALVFTEPTGEHHAQLRQVLNDYIAGDLTTSGNLIRSAALTQPSGRAAPAPRRPALARLRATAGTVLVLAATVALVGVAAELVGSRLFVTELAAPARVVPAGQVLRATADGQLSYLDLGADKGEVLYAIDSSRGDTLSIAMPCDCDAQAVSVAEGSTVLAGEPLVALSQGDAAPLLAANVPQQALFAIYRGGGVTAELPGGESFRARLADGAPRAALPADGGAVPVTFRPDEAIDPGLIGAVAALRIDEDPAGALAPVTGAARAAAARAGALWTAAAAGTSELWTARVAPLFAPSRTQEGEDQ